MMEDERNQMLERLIRMFEPDTAVTWRSMALVDIVLEAKQLADEAPDWMHSEHNEESCMKCRADRLAFYFNKLDGNPHDEYTSPDGSHEEAN